MLSVALTLDREGSAPISCLRAISMTFSTVNLSLPWRYIYLAFRFCLRNWKKGSTFNGIPFLYIYRSYLRFGEDDLLPRKTGILQLLHLLGNLLVDLDANKNTLSFSSGVI